MAYNEAGRISGYILIAKDIFVIIGDVKWDVISNDIMTINMMLKIHQGL